MGIEIDGPRTKQGELGQYWTVESLRGYDVVVRLKAQAPDPKTGCAYEHDEYIWYWLEEVLNPEWGMVRCRDDRLKQQLSEMQVLAWVAK